MNFFDAQDAARRNTTRLVVLFGLAVVALVVLTNLLIAITVILYGGSSRALSATESLLLLPEDYWLWITIGVVGVVGAASAYKYLALSGGGRDVAEGLGGRLIPSSTQDLKQRRLLNVVEEMAIASGVGVPPVYLLDEQAINAFAAGFSVDDAVIGVTQGAVEILNRDELQAVIGHEFSHILNGDTRINLRLMAVLHGILFLGLVGYAILRGGSRGGRNAAPALLLAAGLITIGFAGTFCGSLIKAGVSRQREYLADAASVQFTRNPGGMASALKKIGATTARIDTPAASEASHMFFGQAVRNVGGRLTSTHPPLEDRIRAIEPRWDGTYPRVEPQAVEDQPRNDPANAEPGEGMSATRLVALAGAPSVADGIQTAAAMASIDTTLGQPSNKQVARARALIDTTDAVAHEAAHDPWGARAMVYAMVISSDETLRRRQLDYVLANADKGVPQFLSRLIQPVAAEDLQHRLTLVELSMPALKSLSDAQYRRFIDNLIHLIKIDRKIDLAEWVLHRILMKELRPHFDGPIKVRATLANAAKAPDACATLLSALARLGPNERTRCEAFAAGIGVLEIDAPFASEEDANFTQLNSALNVLRRLKPLAKPKLLKACATTVSADGKVCSNEASLLQGVAATLDCPLPPLLDQ